MGKKRVIEKVGDAEKKGAAEGEGAVIVKGKKQGGKTSVQNGRIYIQSTFNNTMVTITDENGGVIGWASAGAMGFAGPKKATPFAASKVVTAIAEKVAKSGPHSVHVYVSGVGPGRDSAVRSIASSGFDVLSINDVTPIPHNGPRSKRARRM